MWRHQQRKASTAQRRCRSSSRQGSGSTAAGHSSWQNWPDKQEMHAARPDTGALEPGVHWKQPVDCVWLANQPCKSSAGFQRSGHS